MSRLRKWRLWAMPAVGITTVPLAWAAGNAVPPSGRRQPTPAQTRVAFAGALPRMDGAHLQAKVIEITYAPGASSPAHRHPCAVVGYVIEGALRVKVNDGAETIVTAGETFYEAPNDLHAVSANASRTERVKFLAFFTCDREGPLVLPAHTGP